MKFPLSMLREFVESTLDVNPLGDLLTMAGFEVEGIDQVEGQPVLDIKVVSNRGDGLSVFGLAREVLAKDEQANPTELYQRAVRRFDADKLGAVDNAKRVGVSIDTEDCTRYACILFEGVQNAGSPAW